MGMLCRDCCTLAPDDAGGVCARCGGRRLLIHAELDTLTTAHLDCDAFYAAVEKRDNPSLAPHPVIVGGGKRGVVLTCCYVARRYGVRSAMPMYRALKLCPEAVIVRPDFDKYQRVGREVRELMVATTPQVEPISIDEAFLELAGTERLHGGPAAVTLARLQRRVEDEIKITVSIGLSYNKFLAKLASGLDKPRGFSVIGRAEAVTRLAPLPIGMMWGVGPKMQARLEADGIATIGALREQSEARLIARYGTLGQRFARLARGEDAREVEPGSERKSLSAETTFENDIADIAELRRIAWRLSEKVSAGLKAEKIAGRTIQLKLKTPGFRIITRTVTLAHPTQLAETIYRAAEMLLAREAGGRRFRLIGVGVSGFAPAADADPFDLADPNAARRADIERVIDRVRAKFGRKAIVKGRSLK